MYSFPNLEPVCCSMSSSNCCFLTCIQISQEAVQVVWYSHLFKNFPQFIVIHTVKGVGIVKKAEIDVFLELSCFFFLSCFSSFSAFSKSNLNICKFSVHVLLKPSLENFEHCFACMWDECNCVVVWTLFGISFLWDWNENGPFPAYLYCDAKRSRDVFGLVPFRLRSERDKEFFRQTGRGRAFLAEGYACTKVSKEAFKSKDANCPLYVSWWRFWMTFAGEDSVGYCGWKQNFPCLRPNRTWRSGGRCLEHPRKC